MSAARGRAGPSCDATRCGGVRGPRAVGRIPFHPPSTRQGGLLCVLRLRCGCGVVRNGSWMLLRLTDAANDATVRLLLGGATNPASFAAAVQEHRSFCLLSKLYSVGGAHVLETGYGGGAESVSVRKALSTRHRPRTTAHFHPPVFYSPDVPFSRPSWAAFGTVVKAVGTAETVARLYNAWARKRALLDAKNTGETAAFFEGLRPASSPVAPCALADSPKSLCPFHGRGAARRLDPITVRPPTQPLPQSLWFPFPAVTLLYLFARLPLPGRMATRQRLAGACTPRARRWQGRQQRPRAGQRVLGRLASCAAFAEEEAEEGTSAVFVVPVPPFCTAVARILFVLCLCFPRTSLRGWAGRAGGEAPV